jgi:hypothetical protein
MSQKPIGCAVGVVAAILAIGVLAAGGWLVAPLQSPLIPTLEPPTPTLVPTMAPPTITPGGPPTPTPDPLSAPSATPTPGPSPTPDTVATSQSVIATITALAATPTYPPTSTPRPFRTPIGAGAEENAPRATAQGNADVAVRTVSRQVFAGGSAALTIEASPGAQCSLGVLRERDGRTVVEPIAGAPAQATGRNGAAAWIWTVDAKEPAGIMRLFVDCGQAGETEAQLRVAQ